MLTPADFRYLVLHYRAVQRGESDPLPKEFINDLKDALSDLAILYERTDPARILQPDPSHPGYLTAHMENWAFFVPWPLAKYFPRPDTLKELLAVAGRVSVRSHLPICISGSCALLGADLPVCDLDFCQ
jgi:hypothetical protein